MNYHARNILGGFCRKYELKEKPTENVVVKKLLSTAQGFTETIIKEVKILMKLEHKNIVSFKAVCEEPMAMMSDSPF